MALITINGVTVLTGTILMPLVGVWTADLVIDQPDGTGFDAGTAVSIQSENGFELKGTVAPNRTGDFLDAVHVRVLGGAGGMAKQATPRSFVQPGAFARDVMNGLSSDSGETISSITDSGFLEANLVAWAVVQVPASQALTSIINIVAPQSNWRILADGTLWVGAETWPASTVTFDILEQNPTDHTADLGVEAPSILPGYSLDGVGNVNRVEHQIMSSSIRSHVWLDMPEGQRGIAAAITALVSQATNGIDYFAFYSGTVRSQSPDLTAVDITPNDPRLPGMGSVPLRHGIPAFTAQVVPGCSIMLGWDAGDPSKPFACLWGGGETITSLSIGTAADNVLTKADETALIAAISAATCGAPGAPLVWVPPPVFSSTTVKVQR